MGLRLLAAAAALVALAASGSPAAAQRGRAAVHRDWSQVAVRTPEGGVRLGNPAAPVKLIEYGSISCPHCAHFQESASTPLRQRYIRSGRVSWEYRPFMIFPTDPGLFLLLNCLPAPAFFPAADALYASQSGWVARVTALPPAQLQEIDALPPAQKPAALVRAAGLVPFFQQHGLTQARIDQCLADPQGVRRLAGVMQVAATRLHVRGTPTFFINGAQADAADWPTLEARLRAATGG